MNRAVQQKDQVISSDQKFEFLKCLLFCLQLFSSDISNLLTFLIFKSWDAFLMTIIMLIQIQSQCKRCKICCQCRLHWCWCKLHSRLSRFWTDIQCWTEDIEDWMKDIWDWTEGVWNRMKDIWCWIRGLIHDCWTEDIQDWTEVIQGWMGHTQSCWAWLLTRELIKFLKSLWRSLRELLQRLFRKRNAWLLWESCVLDLQKRID